MNEVQIVNYGRSRCNNGRCVMRLKYCKSVRVCVYNVCNVCLNSVCVCVFQCVEERDLESDVFMVRRTLTLISWLNVQIILFVPYLWRYFDNATPGKQFFKEIIFFNKNCGTVIKTDVTYVVKIWDFNTLKMLNYNSVLYWLDFIWYFFSFLF